MDCHNHPHTPGIGLCVLCRRVVCEACTTRLQGRNTCRSCLDARREALADKDIDGSEVGLSALVLLASAAGGLASWGGLLLFGFLLYVAG